MTIKQLLATICLLSLLMSSASASLISYGEYTTDSDSGLDWLRWDTTKNQSYNYVDSQFSTGGIYEGWRYASSTEAEQFLAMFGYDTYSLDWESNSTSQWDLLASYMGYDSTSNQDYFFMYGMVKTWGTNTPAWSYQQRINNSTNVADHVFRTWNRNLEYEFLGSFLVRETTVVPIPASAWLLISGFVSLITIARRKM